MKEIEVELAGHGVATDYAETLLRSLGVNVVRVPGPLDPHPAHAWARSGAMALTGYPNGAPRLVPGPIASAADGALRALAALAAAVALPRDGAALLGERAAVAGLTRAGNVSPGGACRLLRAADGWVAVQLARDEDRASLSAWLQTPIGDAPWDVLRDELPRHDTASLLERARWLGLPVASAAPSSALAHWGHFDVRAHPRNPTRPPRVLDLSGLWAGPLAGALLHGAGAEVVKVESTERPDGARAGPPDFFDLLNADKRSVALDLTRPAGRDALRELVRSCDIVLESTRPRALEQLGIFAPEECALRPQLLWIGITGYGREDLPPGRVAFGDDAAVAAGLAEGVGRPEGVPLFCGDAIADPLTGIHAALAAWTSWRQAVGGIVDLSLRDVAAHAFHFAPGATEGARVEGDANSARVVVDEISVAVAIPQARQAKKRAPDLGADTREVLDAMSAPC